MHVQLERTIVTVKATDCTHTPAKQLLHRLNGFLTGISPQCQWLRLAKHHAAKAGTTPAELEGTQK